MDDEGHHLGYCWHSLYCACHSVVKKVVRVYTHDRQPSEPRTHLLLGLRDSLRVLFVHACPIVCRGSIALGIA